MNVAVDPQMLLILERLRASPAIDYAQLPIAEAREIFDRGAAPWCEPAQPVGRVDPLEVPGAAGSMRGRLYRPAGGRLPVVVFIHGGGWTFGSVDTHDAELRALACASRAAVLGFDYRLAPEHPFPAPLDDVLAALAWVDAGGLGPDVDATRLTVAGDSAGANLALAALIARRRAGVQSAAAAALFYGCYAPDFNTESHRRLGDGRFGISSERMRWYWSNFLGGGQADAASLATPLCCDLAGLPPVYLAAAGLDPLLDDTLALSRRLSAAGVDHRLDFVPGVIHGFLRMRRELPVARRTFDAAGAYLASQAKFKSVGGDHDGTQNVS